MRIIIVGCGRLGGGLSESLSLAGHKIAVIDNDPASFERLNPALRIKTVLGTGFDRNALIASGIDRADGLAAATASDDVNVVVARIANQVFRVPKVVARVYDPRKAEIYQRLGLQTIATTTWGINRMAELLTYSELNTVLSLGTGQVDIVAADVSPLIVGHTVKDLTVPGEITVIAISRGGRSFLPTLGAIFQENDKIHLAIQAASAGHAKELLGL
ncbi:MAG: NAD-binding protein [Pseudomonadota bacterium]